MPGPDRQGTLAGLTSAEAALRLRQWGPNVLAPVRRLETTRQIAGWLGSPLIPSVPGSAGSSTDGPRSGSRRSLGVGASLAAGVALPFTPLAAWLGFTPLPPLFFGVLVTMIVTYLGLVEIVKKFFYRRYPM
jgi:Mg2+-importing ATPase